MNRYLTTIILSTLLLPLSVATEPLETKEEETLNAIINCMSITISEKRLSCYDAALQRDDLLSQDAMIPIKEDTQPKIIPNKIENDFFGKTGKALEKTIAMQQKIIIPNELSSTIIKTSLYTANKYVIELSNGQKWKLLEPTRKGLFSKGRKISIKKGALGSFKVNLEGLNKTYRVKRLN